MNVNKKERTGDNMSKKEKEKNNAEDFIEGLSMLEDVIDRLQYSNDDNLKELAYKLWDAHHALSAAFLQQQDSTIRGLMNYINELLSSMKGA
jgi:hypothetical protein